MSGCLTRVIDTVHTVIWNLKPGGAQPAIRDTVRNGKTQKIVLPDGHPKCMKIVLDRSAIDTTGTR